MSYPQAGRERGDDARLASFVGAIAIGDLVKTTLGPCGMDKILQSTDPASFSVNVTNDGATILKSIFVDNAAAKILIDMSRTQDQNCGDGTTSVVVLAAELLRRAEELICQDKLHPQAVIRGYREASSIALKALNNANERQKFLGMDKLREQMKKVAITTLSSKLLESEKDIFANMAVDAVFALYDSETRNLCPLDYISVIKKPGGILQDSYLDRQGFLLEKSFGNFTGNLQDSNNSGRVIKNCRIVVANCPMDQDRIKIYGAKVKVDSYEASAEIERSEKSRMRKKVEQICNLSKCNVFINRQLVYNYPEQVFAEHGVSVIEHADFEGVERLASVLGAKIVSTFGDDSLVTDKVCGECEAIEEVMIGEDRLLRFRGCSGNAKNAASSIVIRGSSGHILDEAERSLHDALCVVYQGLRSYADSVKKEGTTSRKLTDMISSGDDDFGFVYGGGSCEMAMALAISDASSTMSGKLVFAMDAFAKALLSIPMILADNGGYDAGELCSELRKRHRSGQSQMGLNLYTGKVDDMDSLGVYENYRSKKCQLIAASEAAEMVIRVDDIIRCAPRQRS